MSDAQCALPGCDRPVKDQAYVCQSCTAHLQGKLRDASWLHGELVTTLARLGSVMESVGGRSAETALPYHQAAGDALRELRRAVGSWALWISNERGVPVVEATPPELVGPRCLPYAIYGRCQHGSCRRATPALSTEAVAGWLLEQVEWIRHNKHAATIVGEIESAVGHARQVIDLPADRTRFPVGPCPERVEDADCAGTVWAHIPSSLENPASIDCDLCAATWDATQWRRLGSRIKARMATSVVTPIAWISPADVSHLYRVAYGTVYVLAQRHRWQRRKLTGGRVEYDLENVDRTLGADTLTSRGA